MPDTMVTAQSPGSRPSASAFYTWEISGKPISIQLSLDVVDRLDREVVHTFRAITSRGSEVGGLLLGSVVGSGKRTIVIEDHEPVPCDYRRGPLYLLADADKRRLEEALNRWKTKPDKPLTVVGYYRSNTRKDLALDDDDLPIITEYFSAPHNVILLVKPFASKANLAGFFIWEGGKIERESSLLTFPFSRAELLKGSAGAVVAPPAGQPPPGAAPRVPPPAAAPPAARTFVETKPVSPPPISRPGPVPPPGPERPPIEVKPVAAAPPPVVAPPKVDRPAAPPPPLRVERPTPPPVAPAAPPRPERPPIAARPVAAAPPPPLRVEKPAPPPVAPVAPPKPERPPIAARPVAAPPPKLEKPAALTAPPQREKVAEARPAPAPPSAKPAPPPREEAEPVPDAGAMLFPGEAFAPSAVARLLIGAARLARSRLIRVSAGVILLGGLGTVAYLEQWIDLSPLGIPARENTSTLALKVERSGGQLLLSWNRNATLLKTAQRAVLSIGDGDHREDIELDLGQLRGGSIVYSPITGDVSFRLEVTDLKKGKSLSESVRVLAGRPSPSAPAAAEGPVPGAQPPSPGASKPAGPAVGAVTPPGVRATKPVTPEPAAQSASEAPKPTAPPGPARGESLAARLSPAEPLAPAPELPRVDIPVTTATPGTPLAPPPLVQPPKPTGTVTSAAKPATPPETQAAKPTVEPAKPATGGPLRVGGVVREAKLIRRRDPVYPPLARQARLQGIVRVVAVIGVDGKIEKADPVSGPPLLRQAAVDAVKQWIYQPSLLNGQPVRVTIEIDVNFSLGR